MGQAGEDLHHRHPGADPDIDRRAVVGDDEVLVVILRGNLLEEVAEGFADQLDELFPRLRALGPFRRRPDRRAVVEAPDVSRHFTGGDAPARRAVLGSWSPALPGGDPGERTEKAR